MIKNGSVLNIFIDPKKPHAPLHKRIRWGYILLTLADVEANYLVVKAYKYTSITNVMLLDCFTLPCVMVLSFVFLRMRYRYFHFAGVMLCMVGLTLLIYSDLSRMEQEGEDTNQGDLPWFGDLLCLSGAFLYAVSNVGQEFVVTSESPQEFLSFLGVYGVLVNGTQMLLLERDGIAEVQWSLEIVGYFLGFSLCLFTMYSLAPYLLIKSSATFMNLSLLTSDAYGLLVGVFLFNYKPSLLYAVAFALIITGIVIFNKPDGHRASYVEIADIPILEADVDHSSLATLAHREGASTALLPSPHTATA
eukprot:GCRY01000414.1.p1 GENE.GCRY01000414.1~~GCRY01000414.1.p1  ORF type:complete len:305 (+),score=75.75 GCRY01000414.1:1302-2216(+)